MINFNRVKKTFPGYSFFKFLSDLFHDYIFYRSVKYTGKKNIPKNKPLLFSPNHQNALMDPMAILSSRKFESSVFLARSDIFNNDLLGNLFVNLKILPVYRLRDGKEKLKLNEDIFNLSVEVLEMNKVLTIYPEAEHTPFRSVLQLKKGLMRVAFHTAAKNNFNIDLKIIPIGIYYENYWHYRSKLLVNYGKPISIIDYKQLYNENQQAALVKLKNDLYEAITQLAIHIKNKDDYNFYENCRELFDYSTAKNDNLNHKKIYDKFLTDKKNIKKIDDLKDKDADKYSLLKEKVTDYFEILKKNKLKDYLFDKPVTFIGNFIVSLLYVLLLPLKLAGFAYFAIPVCLPELLVKKFKDKQFHSSIRYVVSFFLPFIWAVLGFFILWIFVDLWWVKFVFFFAYIPLFVIWLEMRKLFKKIIGKWRFLFNSKARNELKNKRTEIMNLFDNI